MTGNAQDTTNRQSLATSGPARHERSLGTDMANVRIKMKDGTIRDFLHRGRSGGSYTVIVKYEGAFVIVTDEYDRTTAIPASEIAEVESTPIRGGW